MEGAKGMGSVLEGNDRCVKVTTAGENVWQRYEGESVRTTAAASAKMNGRVSVSSAAYEAVVISRTSTPPPFPNKW